MKKEIIFVTIGMGGGGTERAISVLANKLAKMGHTVSILMIAKGDIAYELHSDIVIKQVGTSSGGSIKTRIKRILTMRKFFKAHKGSNIIGMGSVASIFALIANFGIKNRVLISERNNPNRLNGKPYSKKMKLIRDFLYKRADVCVFQTEDARDYFTKLSPKKTCVIPNSLVDKIREPFMGDRKKEVVYVGRLIPEKNPKLALDGFTQFVRLHPEYILRFYGEGELKEQMEKYIRELELDKKVFLHPFTKEIHDAIAEAGIYVSSSDGEGLSNSIMEAMALGIPTIATDCPIGGSKMCIQNNENGILIPVGDKEALCAALCKIAENPDFARKISSNAVNVREKFSEERIVQMWLEKMI